ncbi:MAG: hypothetical protein WKF53_16445, partial [Rubrobacter sp.]
MLRGDLGPPVDFVERQERAGRAWDGYWCLSDMVFLSPCAVFAAEVAFDPAPVLGDYEVGSERFDLPVRKQLLWAIRGLGARRENLDDEARILLDERVVVEFAGHDDVGVVDDISGGPELDGLEVDAAGATLRGVVELASDVEDDPVVPLGRAGHGVDVPADVLVLERRGLFEREVLLDGEVLARPDGFAHATSIAEEV